ncbi:metal-dependent hydrolase [Bacillus smithii]|uniref:metal-dependent hydrolase n=1 Tax=Bacillus smithii TaxID=1479 RepID=UPI002E204C1B|nr:metal-dependent hydrolase [Bacillus smithii]
MEGKTHIVGGLAAGALYLNLRGAVGHEALFFGSLALGALIPDIDHTGSLIGRKVPLIDNIISTVFGHRSFTHSLLFLVLAFFLFQQTSWPKDIELGILMGMFSHMVLDMLTKQGVKFLWPLNIEIGIPFGIRTGGAIEQGFFTVLVVYLCYVGFHFYL